MIRRRLSPSIVVTYIAIVVSVLAVLNGLDLRDEQGDTEATAFENRHVACALADLVAHVPAVQFEGESTANFVGWIDARRDLYEAARVAEVCEPDVVAALEDRIRRDEKLLATLPP